MAQADTTAIQEPATDDLSGYCRTLAEQAYEAGRRLTQLSGGDRQRALWAIADAIDAGSSTIQTENARDLDAGRTAGLSDAMLDRLTLNAAGVAKVAQSVRQIAQQPDPVGGVIEGRVLPNGIRLEKRRVPIGVVLMIYESRPNVTADAAALCLKSGNAVILRGGKEARHSNAALATCVRQGLAQANVPPDAVQLVQTTDRAAVGELLHMEGLIDLAIPRGGESLIRAVVEQSRIPVIKHYTGNCHIYLDAACEDDMAVDICLNAKTQRPGVCNAVETLLFHHDAAERGLLKNICNQLTAAGVEIRGCPATQQYVPDVKPADETDWSAEYLDLIVAVKVVDDIDEAIHHINHFGSRHTDAIVTSNVEAAERFINEVDSADVFLNCSTRFSDGSEYGLGAEIGISTDKLHARGPMGAADLTTYKWVARGNGQIRT